MSFEGIQGDIETLSAEMGDNENIKTAIESLKQNVSSVKTNNDSILEEKKKFQGVAQSIGKVIDFGEGEDYSKLSETISTKLQSLSDEIETYKGSATGGEAKLVEMTNKLTELTSQYEAALGKISTHEESLSSKEAERNLADLKSKITKNIANMVVDDEKGQALEDATDKLVSVYNGLDDKPGNSEDFKSFCEKNIPDYLKRGSAKGGTGGNLPKNPNNLSFNDINSIKNKVKSMRNR